jgi:hypothetical protein
MVHADYPGEITLKVRYFADTRSTGRNGGTGRRAGLKIPKWPGHSGALYTPLQSGQSLSRFGWRKGL